MEINCRLTTNPFRGAQVTENMSCHKVFGGVLQLRAQSDYSGAPMVQTIGRCWQLALMTIQNVEPMLAENGAGIWGTRTFV